jgi:mono/diheme cytochrome c family protein
VSLIASKRTRYIALTAIVLAAVVVFSQSSGEQAESGTPIVTISLPKTLSENAIVGEIAFNQYCAACHGINVVGQVGVAPPLVHKIYEPSHHGDASFVSAAKVGVPQHHWPFGSMPPVDGITDDEIVTIIHYIRELQRANGIQ